MMSTFLAACSCTARRILLFGRHRIGEVCIDRVARTGAGCTDAASSEQQLRTAGAPLRLIGPDLEHHVAALDAERHRGGDAEITLAVEIIHDGLAREILRQVGQALLEAGMHMRADDRRHHGLAVEAYPGASGRQRDVAFAADPRDDAAFDQQRCILDRGTAVACNDAGTFEEDGLRGRALGGEQGRQNRGHENRNHSMDHLQPPARIVVICPALSAS